MVSCSTDEGRNIKSADSDDENSLIFEDTETERLMKTFVACLTIASDSEESPSTKSGLEIVSNCPPFLTSAAGSGRMGIFSAISTIDGRTEDSGVDLKYHPHVIPTRTAQESSNVEKIEIENDGFCPFISLSLAEASFVAQVAAAFGELEIVREILEQYGQSIVHEKSKSGWNVLHEAARGGRFEIVELLFEEYGADANATTAAETDGTVGNAATAKELVAEIFGNAVFDRDENTHGIYGRKYPGYAINEMLIEAMQHWKDTCIDDFDTCFDDDVETKNVPIPKKTQWTQALFHAATHGDETILERILLKDGPHRLLDTSVLDERDEDGWTLLHLSTMAGCQRCVRLLLNAGANPFARTLRGKPWTPLSISLAFHGNKNKVYSYIRKRTEISKSAPTRYKAPPEAKLSPLLAQYARSSLTELKNAVDSDKEIIHRTDNNGWNLLHEAARAGNIHVVRYLVWQGINVDHITNNGMGGTALWVARTQHGDDHSVVKFLKSIGSSEIAPMKYLQNIVQPTAEVIEKHRRYLRRYDGHAAAARGDTRMLTFLLSHDGFDVNEVDKNDWAPLHEAARTGQEEALALLLENGAIVDLVSSAGTALEIAERRHDANHTAVQLLRGLSQGRARII